MCLIHVLYFVRVSILCLALIQIHLPLCSLFLHSDTYSEPVLVSAFLVAIGLRKFIAASLVKPEQDIGRVTLKGWEWNNKVYTQKQTDSNSPKRLTHKQPPSLQAQSRVNPTQKQS